MKNFSGKLAVITGAASGIGRALAVQLAGRGADLALADIDGAGLDETALMVTGVECTTHVVDVADRLAMNAFAGDVVEHHGRVDLLINNAGVTLVSTAEGCTYEDFEWIMNINFWGVVHGTLAFLPHLKASGDGHVVNISSVFGLLGIPTQSAYNAAKFGVRGFTDALRTELDIERCGVSATTIHPGGIRTNILNNGRFEYADHEDAIDPEEAAADFERLTRTTPEKAAQLILGAVAKNKRRALIGPDAHVFDAAARLSPRFSQWLIGRTAARRDGSFR